MRFEFGALPWELLGARPAMITLTYPGDWRLYVPNSRVFVAHREAFKERWRKKWGSPIGVWVTEFQRRGAPHLHMYVGLPEAVSDEDYRAMQERTMRRKRSEQDLGAYEARRRTPPVSGEFGEWLRNAWWEIVGSGLPAHEKRGVDVAVAFFSERAEAETDRVRVAEYFWRESGKWAQKQAPDGFGSLKFYGRWGGGKLGFNPVVTLEVLDEMVGLELRRLLRKLMEVKLRESAERTGRAFKRRTGRARGRDGLKVFGVDGSRVGPRMLEWAEQCALEKATRVGVDRVVPFPSGPALRAASEFTWDEDTVPDPVWDDLWSDEPPAGDEFDPDAAAEAYWSRRDEERALFDEALDAEYERLRRIDEVRASNGLPPRPRRKRVRIVLPDVPGREG